MFAQQLFLVLLIECATFCAPILAATDLHAAEIGEIAIEIIVERARNDVVGPLKRGAGGRHRRCRGRARIGAAVRRRLAFQVESVGRKLERRRRRDVGAVCGGRRGGGRRLSERLVLGDVERCCRRGRRRAAVCQQIAGRSRARALQKRGGRGALRVG